MRDRIRTGTARVAGAIRRVLPGSRRGRITLAALAALAGAASWGANYYLENVPTRMADDYRREARVAAGRLGDAMHATYESFDDYVAANTLPRGFFREIDTAEEYRRRIEPILTDLVRSLDRAANARKRAAAEVEQAETGFPEVPSKPLLDGRGDLDEAEDRAREARRYLRRARGFLDEYERFVEYESQSVTLLQRSALSDKADAIHEATGLEAFKAAIAAALAEASEIRDERLDLKPPAATKDLHDLLVAGDTIWVDYLERLETAIEALSIAGLEAADADLVDEFERNGDEFQRAWQTFTARSSLQRDSRRLGSEVEELERAITELGSGGGSVNDRDRPPPPPPPKPGGPPDNGDQSAA